MEVRQREVWSFRKADWESLKERLEAEPWADHCAVADIDDCVHGVVERILACSRVCIPMRLLEEKKSTHEWITPEIIEEVKKKNDAAGTVAEKEAAEQCSLAIVKEFHKFVDRKRKDLQSEKQGSKNGGVRRGSWPSCLGRQTASLHSKGEMDGRRSRVRRPIFSRMRSLRSMRCHSSASISSPRWFP